MKITNGRHWIASFPVQHRANFLHLILDIAWFGVLNGSAIAFAAVFAARQGANALQIGLLSASPAFITLFLALPSGKWLQKKPVSRGVFLSSLAHRWFYLLWVFLPLIFAPTVQVWSLIAIIALMSIPGTALAIGFNGLFAMTVPPEWRAPVTGARNAAFALTSIVVILLCGWLLDHLPFPLGYQVVFALGFLAAMMSSYHLRQIRPQFENAQTPAVNQQARDWAQPGIAHFWNNLRTGIGMRFFMQRPNKPWSTVNFMAGRHRFRLVLLLVFTMHLALTLVHPLIPIYLVNQVHFSDQEIALGSSVFYLALFLGSMLLARVSAMLGHHRTLSLGMVLTFLYPLLIAWTQGVSGYLLASIMGGLAWSLAGGSLGNFILEEIPEDTQATHLAWYNIALQAGVLLGALLAPIFVNWTGIFAALIIASAVRLLAGLALWRLPSGAYPRVRQANKVVV